MRTLLTAVFVTALITAQVISSKLIALPMGVVIPGGTLAYAFTYIATDTIGEIYGKQEARTTVIAGFMMNFLLLGLIYATVALPAAKGGIDTTAFNSVLLSGTNIVLGSLVAFAVSQLIDVEIFHQLRARSDSGGLWSRNIISTSVSQVIDTIIFTTVGFWVAPIVLGIGTPLPITVIQSLILGQALVKVLIALGDTPVVYALAWYGRRHARPEG
jgi:hypothetical protein